MTLVTANTSSAELLWVLKPFFSRKVWGWEKWLFSTHPNGLTSLENGPHKNCSLKSALAQGLHNPRQIPQPAPPVLIKIIQADTELSVQVHPDDVYARAHEQSSGKSECWLFLEHSPNAAVISGLSNAQTHSAVSKAQHWSSTRAKLHKLLQTGTYEAIMAQLHSHTVETGAALYIPAGTVHAIGGGVKLLEIQQSSDLTYRLYDYGRKRPLHLKQALTVLKPQNTGHYYPPQQAQQVKTPYFKFEQISFAPLQTRTLHFSKTKSTQTILCVVNGTLNAHTANEVLPILPESCAYAPNGGTFQLTAGEKNTLCVSVEAFMHPIGPKTTPTT